VHTRLFVLLLILPVAAVQASGPLGDAIRKEVIVNASVSEVWKAWTTSEGASTWLAERTHIRGELGGPFEVYFLPEAPYGGQGCEGCRIHALDPMKRLAFTWTAPPQFPSIRLPGLMTIVDIQLQSVSADRTRVAFTQYGWGVGGQWADVRRYFESAWDTPLGRLKHRFGVGPIDWKRPPVITESFSVAATIQ
jgi:uncharacterized protein YndB with AHSA1/START domain